jgi:hypothetical protein
MFGPPRPGAICGARIAPIDEASNDASVGAVGGASIGAAATRRVTACGLIRGGWVGALAEAGAVGGASAIVDGWGCACRAQRGT